MSTSNDEKDLPTADDIVIELTEADAVEAEIAKPEPAQDPTKPAEVLIEAPVVEQVAKVAEPPQRSEADDLRAQLETFSKRVEEERTARESERRRREEAEHIAVRIAADLDVAQRGTLEAQLQAVASAIAAEKSELERAESGMRAAHARSDPDLMIRAQKAMVTITRRLADLEDGQVALKQRHEEVAGRPPVQVPHAPVSQAQSNEPKTHDEIISRYTPRTQDYLRKRESSWVTDQRQRSKLQGAHFFALSEGHVPDSDAYFEAVDKQMGVGKAADPAPAAPVATPVVRKAAPAAPVSTKASSQPSGNKISVSLSPSEQEAARHLGLSHNEYGRRKYLMNQKTWNGPKYGQNNA